MKKKKPKIRASSMNRALRCNGSLRLVPMVNDREGDEGFEGVMIHWMIADILIRLHGAIPPAGGLAPAEVPKGYKLNINSLWIVDWCVRHVLKSVPSDWSLMVEVEMEWEFDRWENTGHADWIAFSPDGTDSKGGDWKTGRLSVEPAETNEQVNDYIVLKKLNWPSVKRSEFHVCQPLAREEDGFERVSKVVVKNERLELAAATLDARVCAAIDNDMEIDDGPIQCRFCPVAVQCPAVIKKRSKMKMTLTPEMLLKIKKTPDDATLGDWVVDSKTLAQPMKDAVELLHTRLDTQPAVIAGCGTTITRHLQNGDYSIPDPKKFLEAVRVLLPGDEPIAAAFTPSMTRLKDQIAKTMGINKTGKDPVTAESVFDAHLRPLVEQGKKRMLDFS